MLKATIHLTRRDCLSSQDDIISIYSCSDTSDLVSVYFKTPEFQKKKKFITTESRAVDYIEDILSSLEHDSDPFEDVQIETAIHPVILYHVTDMEDANTRDRILGMIRMALRTRVADV